MSKTNKPNNVAMGTALALTFLTIIWTVGWGIPYFEKSNELAYKQLEKEITERNTVNLKNPQIVGTNENGETIKRYWITYGYFVHYIYEIGNTKTTNIPGIKGRNDVTVEHTE